MQRIHLQDCLQWCDDIEDIRSACLRRGNQELLWIDKPSVGLFACRQRETVAIYVRRGSALGPINVYDLPIILQTPA